MFSRPRAGTDVDLGRLALLLAVVFLLAGCSAASGSVPHRHDGRRLTVSALGRLDDDGDPLDRGARPTVPAQLLPYLARIPRFPPAPPPEPVRVPPGPLAGWYSRIPTSQPVAFITIDDGWTKLPVAPELVAAAHVPVTAFLTIDAIRDDPGYFRDLQAAGAVIEAHTVSHPEMRGMPYPAQRAQACGSADQLAAWYGRRPVLFRPPYGDEDATTLRAVRDCGMPAAFFWTETVRNGTVYYQTGHRVQPGDIILMHFRPTFPADFLAALAAIHDAGLTPALLENYIS